MLTRGSKEDLWPSRHGRETPFIRTRQLHPGGISQDWHVCTCFPPQIPRACNLKNQCPSHTDITQFPCQWTCSPFNEELQSFIWDFVSYFLYPCREPFRNMRNDWEWCYSSIVRDVASPSCQLPKHLVRKTYYPIPFHRSAPSFLSIDDRDQSFSNCTILTPTYSFTKLTLYHILLLDNSVT